MPELTQLVKVKEISARHLRMGDIVTSHGKTFKEVVSLEIYGFECNVTFRSCKVTFLKDEKVTILCKR